VSHIAAPRSDSIISPLNKVATAVHASGNVATNLTVEGFPSAVSHFSIVSFFPPNQENRLVRPPFEGLSAVNKTKRASEKNLMPSGTSH
jgi:hypothetical protein